MMGALAVVGGKLRALLLWLLAMARVLLRRACCCFRRRRRSSGEALPLTGVDVVPTNVENLHLKQLLQYAKMDMTQQGWETWGREEDPVSRQIREYRASLALARQQHEQPPENQQQATDFFQDMTPRITQPPRLTLQTQDDYPVSNTAQLLSAQPVPYMGSELETWEEEEGWEAEEGDWQEEVRQQRKQQRQKRAEEMQIRRSEQRTGLGSRLQS